MPYFIYKMTSQEGMSLVKNLELITELGSFKQAKQLARDKRAELPEDSNEIIKVMFAENQLAAEEQLLEHREKPILMEHEKWSWQAVEENEYKSTYSEIASIRCEFEKSLTNNKARCSYSRHFCLADREGYACKSVESSVKCRELLGLLRKNSRFILKVQKTGNELPHNMEIRVQVGGLSGILTLLSPGERDNIEDIFALVEQAEIEFGSLEKLPYNQIVQSISRYQGRKRRKRN